MAIFNNQQRIMPVYQVDENGVTLAPRATEATQALVLARLGELTDPTDTQPVSVTNLPLPAGAATEATLASRASEATLSTRASEATLATRATEATLAAVNAKLPASLGAKTPAGSFSVVDAVPARFTVVAPSVALTAGKSLLSLVSAGPVVRIDKLYIINVQTTGVTGVAAEFQLRRVTGHSGGTAVTPQMHDTADSLGSVTASTGATVSGESASYLTRGWWATDEWGPGTADVESFDHTMQTLIPAWGGYVIRSGQGLSVRCHSGTPGTFDIILTGSVE